MLDWTPVSIYDYECGYNSQYKRFLFDLLAERLKNPLTNISHASMPTYAEHLEFIDSHPYNDWFVICNYAAPEQCIGTLYLTERNEIGITIAERYQRQGYATGILKAMFEARSNEEFLANINPNNEASIKLFEKFGFIHVQNTYKLKK